MIACDIHDYFEAVCVRQCLVRLDLHSGDSIEGVAIDLKTASGVESIAIKIPTGDTQWIELLQIRRLQAPALVGANPIDITLP